MGVLGLMNLLRTLDPKIVQSMDLSQLSGGKLAIDVAISTFVFKSQYISRVIDKLDCLYYDVDADKANQYMIFEILRFNFNVLKANVIPVTVFDGKSPALKDATKGARIDRTAQVKVKIDELRRIGRCLVDAGQNGRVYQMSPEEIAFLQSFPKKIESIEGLRHRLKMLIKSYIIIKPAEREQIKNILQIMGLPVVQAPSEAEFCCAEMAKRKDVSAVYSTDSDCIMYGCPIFINKLSYMGGSLVPKPPIAQCYTYKNALEVTGLTQTQFSELCIMCGTDFNSNPPGIGPAASLELLKTFGNIKNMMKVQLEARRFVELHPKAKLDNIVKKLIKCDFSVLNYDEVRMFITTPSGYDPKDLIPNIHPSIAKEAPVKLKALLSEKYYNKFLPYLNKIIEILNVMAKPQKANKIVKKKEFAFVPPSVPAQKLNLNDSEDHSDE
tara:strand:+ start:35002 stop:36321 length:1320 start_codon:yes stop_codon:yes gene_type:complete